jgi:hypothetical protein
MVVYQLTFVYFLFFYYSIPLFFFTTHREKRLINELICGEENKKTRKIMNDRNGKKFILFFLSTLCSMTFPLDN